MNFLPVNLNLEGRKILIVGGGRIAAQKLETICQYTQDVELCGIDISPEVRRYPITILERPYGEDLLEGKGLVYACTSDRNVNRRIGADARRHGLLVNVADDPNECDFTSPAIFRQAYMSVAVSSNAQDVRRAISWRNKIKRFIESLPESWTPGAHSSGTKKGKVWLVGFGPGDPALLTFRADRILSEADIIFYDDLIDESVLRRYPAKAVYVGKRKAFHAEEQSGINGQMKAAADAGMTVVRLKGGDPGIFGRGGEEVSFLKTCGIEIEIIPGITAASAAAAALSIPLTQRDVSSEIRIRTGHGSDNGPSKPGTIVYYMAASCLEEIAAELLREGLGSSTPVGIVEKAGLPRESKRRTTLGDLENQHADSPAIVIIGDVVGLSG